MIPAIDKLKEICRVDPEVRKEVAALASHLEALAYQGEQARKAPLHAVATFIRSFELSVLLVSDLLNLCDPGE